MKILRQKSSSKNMIDITCRNMETDSRDVITTNSMERKRSSITKGKML